jgi:predicted ATP-grasp superfamily ATP-dependent carboligase
LAELCATHSIPHPEISAQPPKDGQNWLAKSAGGAGGSHVAPAAAAPADGDKIYFQRIAAGEPVSILFLADGSNAQPVGLSRQWTAPAPGEPYRFGGSIRPAGLSISIEDKLQQAAQTVTTACGLRGLNSIDFLVGDSACTLIEINPRPGATLDIFEDMDGALFRAHLSACLGKLPARPLQFYGAAAAAVAYAQGEISSMPSFDWPYWTADRQKAGSRVRRHGPLCTIKARAIRSSRARALVDARTKMILDRL